MVTRVPRELGRSRQSLEANRIGSNRYSKLRDDPSAMRLRPSGDETQALQRYRQAKETKCGEKTVRKSQRPIVVWKRGNGPSRTPWSEGGAASWTGGWNHAEAAEPHPRVTARPRIVLRDSESTA